MHRVKLQYYPTYCIVKFHAIIWFLRAYCTIANLIPQVIFEILYFQCNFDSFDTYKTNYDRKIC